MNSNQLNSSIICKKSHPVQKNIKEEILGNILYDIINKYDHDYDCYESFIEKIKTLIECGANVNYTASRGRTSILRLIQKGLENYKIIKLFINNGLNVNHENDDGKTCLSYIFEENVSIKFIELLIDANADINQKNYYRCIGKRFEQYLNIDRDDNEYNFSRLIKSNNKQILLYEEETIDDKIYDDDIVNIIHNIKLLNKQSNNNLNIGDGYGNPCFKLIDYPCVGHKFLYLNYYEVYPVIRLLIKMGYNFDDDCGNYPLFMEFLNYCKTKPGKLRNRDKKLFFLIISEYKFINIKPLNDDENFILFWHLFGNNKNVLKYLPRFYINIFINSKENITIEEYLDKIDNINNKFIKRNIYNYKYYKLFGWKNKMKSCLDDAAIAAMNYAILPLILNNYYDIPYEIIYIIMNEYYSLL